MRVFNASYVVYLEDEDGQKLAPIKMQAETYRMDLITELAIQATRISHEREIMVEQTFSNTTLLDLAWDRSKTLIHQYEGGRPKEVPQLQDDEVREAYLLSKTTAAFISTHEGDIEFFPRVPGAGVIDSCEADLSVGDALFEIKTVTRSFRGRDLRQLLIYLALDSASGAPRWTRAGLFNPRLAVWCSFQVDPFVRMISGGRTLREVYDRLIAGFSRDVELDVNF